MVYSGIHQIELVLILLLFLVVGFGALAKRIELPYPIVLVIAGLVMSLIPGIPRVSLHPDLVFLAILPPLLFGAAFSTSWREFRFNLVSIAFLAFGLVGFTVFGVAVVARWILPDFHWRLGLVLGAVVSTTDAIAATSIARRLGLPRNIIDVLEGESLVNDASGLLALEFAVAMLVNNAMPTVGEGALRLVYLVFGGVAVGLLVAKLVHWVEGHVDDAPIEITISILVPYAAYLSAEALHTSGVLATVASGLYLGRRSAEYLSSHVRIEGSAVWNTLTFVLNGIVFLMIGLQLPYILASIRNMSAAKLIAGGALISASVILLRLIWIYPGAYASYFIRRRLLHQNVRTPPAGGIFVVGWTGMRGVVALAAAISLPMTMESGEPFPHRDLILFLTFFVIFVTLVLQGLTLPAIIRRINLKEEGKEKREEEDARREVIAAVLAHLEQSSKEDDPEFRPVYDDLAHHYRQRLASIRGKRSRGGLARNHYNRAREIGQELRNIERDTMLRLRDEDRISDEVLRTMQRELDLIETRSHAAE